MWDPDMLDKEFKVYYTVVLEHPNTTFNNLLATFGPGAPTTNGSSGPGAGVRKEGEGGPAGATGQKGGGAPPPTHAGLLAR